MKKRLRSNDWKISTLKRECCEESPTVLRTFSEIILESILCRLGLAGSIKLFKLKLASKKIQATVRRHFMAARTLNLRFVLSIWVTIAVPMLTFQMISWITQTTNKMVLITLKKLRVILRPPLQTLQTQSEALVQLVFKRSFSLKQAMMKRKGEVLWTRSPRPVSCLNRISKVTTQTKRWWVWR